MSARPSSRPGSRGSNHSSSGSSVNSQDPNVKVTKVGLRKEFATKNGKDYVRTRDIETGKTTAWQKVVKAADAPPTSGNQLYLVRQEQASGEPFHWSLVVCNAENGDFRGNVYQVKGDALNMKYSDNKEGMPVNVLGSNSFHDQLKLGSLSAAQETTLQKIAAAEPPPKAKNMREVKENCQGWTLRVLAKCEEAKIVAPGTRQRCQAKQEAIKK